MPDGNPVTGRGTMIYVRNGSRKWLRKRIVLSEGNVFEVGTNVTVEHYAFGVAPNGIVLQSELYIRVETDDGRLVHLRHEEMLPLTYAEHAEAAE
jgi:hypothetical protein